MRKLKSLDVSAATLQDCRLMLDDAFAEIAVEEEDVVSVQYQWNEGAPPDARCTLLVFYWG